MFVTLKKTLEVYAGASFSHGFYQKNGDEFPPNLTFSWVLKKDTGEEVTSGICERDGNIVKYVVPDEATVGLSGRHSLYVLAEDTNDDRITEVVIDYKLDFSGSVS